jgi:hypothetical protein
MPSNPGAVVYGTITVGALLAGESAQRETYAETVGAVVIALLVYWLAHSYSSFAATRLTEGKPAELAELGRTMVHELSIVLGAAVPLLVLLAAWAAGAGLGSGVNAAIWTSAGMILVAEVVSAVRAEQRGRELAAQVLLGAVLGFLVIALKLVLH